jgi:hypothetical protein
MPKRGETDSSRSRLSRRRPHLILRGGVVVEADHHVMALRERREARGHLDLCLVGAEETDAQRTGLTEDCLISAPLMSGVKVCT